MSVRDISRKRALESKTIKGSSSLYLRLFEHELISRYMVDYLLGVQNDGHVC